VGGIAIAIGHGHRRHIFFLNGSVPEVLVLVLFQVVVPGG
jgi:hypothetical protein